MDRKPSAIFTPAQIARTNWMPDASFVSYRLDWVPLAESLETRIAERDKAIAERDALAVNLRYLVQQARLFGMEGNNAFIKAEAALNR
jgi:hypothetical protein